MIFPIQMNVHTAEKSSGSELMNELYTYPGPCENDCEIVRNKLKEKNIQFVEYRSDTVAQPALPISIPYMLIMNTDKPFYLKNKDEILAWINE